MVTKRKSNIIQDLAASANPDLKKLNQPKQINRDNPLNLPPVINPNPAVERPPKNTPDTSKVKIGVRFNKDNTVDYDPGTGKSVNLTREQYTQLAGLRSNPGSDASNLKDETIKTLFQTEQDLLRKQELRKQIVQQNTDARLLDELAKEGQGNLPPKETGQQQLEGFDYGSDQGVFQNNKQISGAIDTVTNIPAVSGTLQNAVTVVDAINEFLPEGVKIGKRPQEVILAQKVVSDSLGQISADITNVKLGLVNPQDVENSIRLAQQNINDLGQKAHGLGRLDLSFWRDRGRYIEQSVLEANARLTTLRGNLRVAELQSQQQAALSTLR